MKRVYKTGLLMLSLSFLLFNSFAQGSDEEISPRYSDTSLLGIIKSFFNNGEVKNFFSFSQGYDTNVYLSDTNREGDAFTQVVFKSTLTSALNDTTDGILGYRLMSLVYSDESDLDLIVNTFRVGVKHNINSKLSLLTDYKFGITNYINTGVDDFLDHRLRFKLKQKLPDKFYHSLSYELRYKDYDNRKIRLAPTILYSNKKREDLRNTLEYEVGKYFSKDLIRARFQYYHNDSNEHFLDYYDYDSYKTTVSLTHMFDNKTFGYFSFSRQYRDYSARTLILDAGSKEWQRTYVISAGLYYNIKKDLTLSCNYSYRQNWSNERTDRYSGSVMTMGIYYSF